MFVDIMQYNSSANTHCNLSIYTSVTIHCIWLYHYRVNAHSAMDHNYVDTLNTQRNLSESKWMHYLIDCIVYYSRLNTFFNLLLIIDLCRWVYLNCYLQPLLWASQFMSKVRQCNPCLEYKAHNVISNVDSLEPRPCCYPLIMTSRPYINVVHEVS